MKLKQAAVLAALLALAGCAVAAGLNADSQAAERRATSISDYDDGNYTFYFRNGKSVSGDCDGYSFGGKNYCVYEYYRSDIAK
jgi:hypothetical protein